MSVHNPITRLSCPPPEPGPDPAAAASCEDSEDSSGSCEEPPMEVHNDEAGNARIEVQVPTEYSREAVAFVCWSPIELYVL